MLKFEEKEKLYYNKYSYKASFKSYGINYIRGARSIDEYTTTLDKIINDLTHRPYHLPKTLTDIECEIIENVIKFKVNFEDNNLGTLRQEGNSIAFFSNEIDLLTTLDDIDGIKVEYFQAKLLPAGTKYFTNNPPAKYRLQLKETNIDISIKDQLRQYLADHSELKPSSALSAWLRYPSRWQRAYCCSKRYFIDYDDDKNLTMLHLMFSEIVGKNYKLEKRT